MAGVQGINFGDVASGFGDFGGAVGSLFGAQGDTTEAASYQKAAQLSDLNAQFAAQSTAVQQVQTQRQVAKVLGGIRSDIAGAGLAMSGSAQDILRSSAQQGEITRGVIGQQGAINVAAYQEQAASYRAMASAANSAASAGGFGAFLKSAASIASFAGAFA